MSDLLASILLLAVSAGMLIWTLLNRRTIDRGLWKPSISRDGAPSQYWSEVVWMGLFTLMLLGIAMHMAAKQA